MPTIATLITLIHVDVFRRKSFHRAFHAHDFTSVLCILEHAWVVLGPLSYSFTPVAWCSAVVTLYTRGGILMEGADVPLLIANFAGVAVYASQECVSVLMALM